MDGDAVLERLRQRLSSPDYAPPLLPAVALEVHQLAQKREPDIPGLIRTLERDATLAADTLRRAQSASFAGRNPPRTLDEAVIRIGADGVRDLVWEVSLNGRVFRGRPPISDTMEALWLHSLIVAHLARGVASHTAMYEDSAFLVGLLHDVGLACSLLILGEDPAREFDLSLMGSALIEVHAEAGETVARLWNLPDELRWAIAAHHRAELGGTAHPLASIVVLAEAIAERIGHGFLLGQDPLDHPGPAALARACETLGISRPALAQMDEPMHRLLAMVLAN